jgi:hypothetical protein
LEAAGETMRTRILLPLLAATIAMVVAIPLHAQNMSGMEMGGMDMGSGHDIGSHPFAPGPGAMGAMSSDAMSHEHTAMAAHMAWSRMRPAVDGDEARASRIVETLKASIGKYQDYRIAERDGYKPFLPQLKLKEYHFTNYWYGFKAAFKFNPAEPTSLLYKPTPGGGYELVGAMYTAPKGWSEDKLDARVPLSVARWHRHVNLCFPPKGTGATSDWTKFGFVGSISTMEACAAAGGTFHPQLFGWMVHVYPWQTDPAKVWAH